MISHPIVESCTDVLLPILLDLQARSIVLNCLVEFSLLDKSERQAVVCPGLVRIEADRLACKFLGVSELPLDREVFGEIGGDERVLR